MQKVHIGSNQDAVGLEHPFDRAIFSSGRISNALTAAGLFLLASGALFVALYGSEQQLMETRVRRGGGLIKLIEQSIGWEAFAILMIVMGLLSAYFALVSIWKAFDGTPDVTAHEYQMDFHPAVKRESIGYDEITHWTIEFVSGHPVLYIYLLKPYRSMQSIFKRSLIKLEGDREQLQPIVDFFSRHDVMQKLFVKST